MLACKCLNVIIETEVNELQEVSIDKLNLSETESSDDFFKKEIQQVGKLNNITKVHSALVNTRHVGSWTVNYCINCNTSSHAIHQNRGAGFVLVTGDLLRPAAISELRNSDLYSPTFNIVINLYEDDGQVYDIPPEFRSICQSWRHTVSEELRKEAAATEERIRIFTEEQGRALSSFRERVFKEQKALMRAIVKNSSGKNTSVKNMSTSALKSTENTKFASEASDPIAENLDLSSFGPEMDLSDLPEEHTYVTQRSLDAEGLFEFEGIDEVSNTYYHSDIEETDIEDPVELREENSRVSRNRSHSNLAKSLPVNIPVFMTAFHTRAKEEPDEISIADQDPLDIAASIKALARSVHGDAVFGDLPRPRFSTQM